MLALARNLVKVIDEFRGGNFAIRNQLKGMDIEGKTLGIVGMGKIGRLVARKMAAFDMKIIGYDPYLPADRFPAGVDAVKEWNELFSQSDFITLHLPATEETKGIVGKAEFQTMKKSACLINAARGEVIDEKALIEALQSGTIGGAGMDVFSEEPPAEDNPLLRMDNVIATPHNAALTVECMTRMALHAAMGIDDVLNGRTPKWPVNNPK
jgi:D-3-phosphoglycerate dehydrogenase